MATFCDIPSDELFGFLKHCGFKPVTVQGCKEVVYGKRCDVDGVPLTMRVYTSVVEGAVRATGKDAIRVCLFAALKNGDIRMVGGTKRVHRVAGWKTNLASRFTTPELVLCPKCGNPMVEKKGTSKYSKRSYHFLGCAAYPVCRGTRELQETEAVSA